jgi:hypothetical protein
LLAPPQIESLVAAKVSTRNRTQVAKALDDEALGASWIFLHVRSFRRKEHRLPLLEDGLHRCLVGGSSE